MRYLKRSSKFSGSPPCQTRKVLGPLKSVLVSPVMAPSWTDQKPSLPFQPVRSLPLKRDSKPDGASSAEERTTSREENAVRTTAVTMSVRRMEGLRKTKPADCNLRA